MSQYNEEQSFISQLFEIKPMKMKLIGYADGEEGQYTDLTKFKIYDHIGAGFADNENNRRLVSSFTWQTPTAQEIDFLNFTPKEPTSASDTQVGGSHYKSLGVQPMELVLKNMGFIAFEGACYTKINKYMIRHKDNKVEQLKKAAHILQMWIEEAENQQSM